MLNNPSKLITILGSTATGKTQLAVKLARKFNGEIISADSRQVYKYMDIGTGKDLAEYGKGKDKIACHLIDTVKPATEFNLAKFKKRALRAMKDIVRRGKVAWLVGGTGLYISSIVEDYKIPNIKPDLKLRKKLEATSLSKLVLMLKKKDLGAYKKVDLKNKQRVVRALEIALTLANETQLNFPNGDRINRIKPEFKRDVGKKCPNGRFFPNISFLKSPAGRNAPRDGDFLILGMKIDRETLKQKIDQRVDKMIQQGLVDEVKRLHEKYNVPWKKFEEFGMEYKYPALYLRGRINKAEMIERIKTTNRQFAKRQMTWFRGMERRGVKINWVNNYEKAEKLIMKYL